MFTISPSPRVRKSPFFDATVAAGATSFTVYNHMLMPTGYGNPEGEYWRLVNGVALWDVAVERQVELRGPDAAVLAQALCPRDMNKCAIGQGRYVPICDHQGRILNDPVIQRLSDDQFWLSLADSDLLLWARAVANERGLDVEVSEPDISPLAVQGPNAEAVVRDLFGDWVGELKYFWFRWAELDGIPLIVARSGWSRQGGFELYLADGRYGMALWDKVMEAGAPYDIGPGNPNPIERVESGLISYGTDTDAETNPFELGMDRFVEVDGDFDFIGKPALARIKAEGPARRRVGLFIDGPPLGTNTEVWPVARDGETVGQVRVAVYSIRLQRNIAHALITADIPFGDDALVVETADGPRAAEITTIPFC